MSYGDWAQWNERVVEEGRIVCGVDSTPEERRQWTVLHEKHIQGKTQPIEPTTPEERRKAAQGSMRR